MSQLLAAIANRQSQTRTTATVRYYELVKADNPADAAELLELLDVLGKSSTDVAKDLKVIAEYRTYQQNIVEGKRLFSEQVLKDAEKKLEDFDVETYRLERGGKFDSGRIWGRQKLQLEFNNLNAQRSGINGNYNRLHDLAQKHPALLLGM